ncbi:MAG: folate family ECF transporter S component [Bacilli bacterium]|jgi:ECF transporter S component (folate family)|nr:folate family ECF transporter S component [Bacilli bacterium]HHU24227.1 folate family ECF transporter S component [Acholeplasmataceae bacterium]
MPKRNRSIDITTMVLLSILVAFAIALKVYSFTTISMRISFFAIPILVAGMIAGPALGGLAGFLADCVYGLVFSSFAYNPFFAISMTLWGVVGGFLPRKQGGKVNILAMTIMVLFMSLLETSINTLGMYLFYGASVAFADLPLRIITLFVKWPFIVASIKILDERLIYQFIVSQKLNSSKVKKATSFK